MFVDMATANPVVFVDHVTSLKEIAEQQPVYIHQVVQIIGAIGTVSQVSGHFIYSLLTLTHNPQNFLNGLVQVEFLELFIINFGDIKMRLRSWSSNSL